MFLQEEPNLIESSYLDEIDLPRHGGRVEAVAEERGVSPESIMDFSANMNPLAPPETLEEYLTDSAGSLELYPDDRYEKFRSGVVNFLRTDAGTWLNNENVIPGNGSVELFRLFLRMVVAGEGERVLVPFPTFSEYELQAKLLGLKVDRKGYDEVLDFTGEDLAGYSAVFLCNPNNPTGTLRKRKRLAQFASTCGKADTLLLLDEAFIELARPEESLVGLVNRFPNLVVVRSLTKTFAIPGLRLAYGVVSNELSDRMEKLRPPWNLNYLASYVGRRFLDEESELLNDSREYLETERDWLGEALEDLGFWLYPSSTNFILFRTRKVGLTASEIVDRCLDSNVLVRNADSFYGLDEWHVRVAVKKREENERLTRALKKSVA